MLNGTTIPKVTIVMPVFNEGQFLEQTLEQVVTQDYPKNALEILVVDGGSRDNTKSIVNQLAEEHPNIKLLDNPKRRSSAGRNIGFKKGTGDYFVIIDGHCYLPNDQLIKSIVKAFQKSGADCLGRPQLLDPPGLTNFQKAVASARAAPIGHSGASFIYNDFEGFISPQSNGAAYKKEVFNKVGYVDESFDAAEDLEFNYRIENAGLSCYTEPSLTVKYYPRESIGSLFRQLSRYGQGRKRFVWKHPGALTLNQLIPLFFVIGFGGLVPSLMWMVINRDITFLSISFVVPYCFYTLLIWYVAFVASSKNSWKYFLPLLAIFFVIHFALGWGFVKEMILWETDD